MVCGYEEVAPTEIVVALHWRKYLGTTINDDKQRQELYQADNKCWALMDMQGKCISQQVGVTIYKSSLTNFLWGEMAWRWNEIKHQDKTKYLSPKWERPSIVIIIEH